MALNRKQFLRYTGAAAAGASLGAVVRGLVAPAAPDAGGGGILEPTAGWATPPAQAGSAPATPPRIVGTESFSQCGEDLVVAFTMGYLGMGPHITYLDVGANDPVNLNNTYYFYRRGHCGVLVEPNGALCRSLRDRRRGDTVLEAGIGGGAGGGGYYGMRGGSPSARSRAGGGRPGAGPRGRGAVPRGAQGRPPGR